MLSPLLQQRLGVGHAAATMAVSPWVWLEGSCRARYVTKKQDRHTCLSHPALRFPPKRDLNGSHSRRCSPVLGPSPVFAAGRIPLIAQEKYRGTHEDK